MDTPEKVSSCGTVLSLFDYTGNMVRPWANAGYECWCLDIRHESGYNRTGNIVYVGTDVLRWQLPLPKKYAIVFAFPPCTHLAVSGARWWKGKGLHALSESIELVARSADICNESGAPWMIENPIGALSTHWRKPDHYFDPCDYGGYGDSDDAYTKKTCLWVGAVSLCRNLAQFRRHRAVKCTSCPHRKIGRLSARKRQRGLRERYSKRTVGSQ